MKRPCSNNRFHLIPSLILLSLSLVSPGLAAEVPLRPFTASYNLHKGSMHIAVSEISLQQMDQLFEPCLLIRDKKTRFLLFAIAFYIPEPAIIP